MTTRLGTTPLRPGDAGYDEARAAWNRNARLAPAAVVMAECAQDVQAAVRLARSRGSGRRGAGDRARHGDRVCRRRARRTPRGCAAVEVDPVARTARVAAGARWGDVIPAAAAHGLAGLPGSSSHVGVVGFTMGGGFGWLGRRYGLASGSVRVGRRS